MSESQVKDLSILSAKIRKETIKMLKWRKYGHLGGSLSIVELLSVLYGKHLKYDPKNPNWEDRDYLVLSKGHAGPSLYSALAVHGFFEEEMLYTLNELGTKLPSHPDRLKTPGVDVTTGSLGQGTSFAAGLGHTFKMEGSDQKVYLICGDGELNEGQCWEAFQFIASEKLHQVIVLIDKNNMQLDGHLDDVINPFDIGKKMEAFGFHVQTVTGCNEGEIDAAITKAKEIKDQAVCIILDTTKCQGVTHYYDRLDNHAPKFGEEEDKMLEGVIKGLEDYISKEEANV